MPAPKRAAKERAIAIVVRPGCRSACELVARAPSALERFAATLVTHIKSGARRKRASCRSTEYEKNACRNTSGRFVV
jgi:hypothetical protein